MFILKTLPVWAT